jgi:hypothetical protein
MSMSMPAPRPQPAGFNFAGMGQQFTNFFRNPKNLANVIGMSGGLGQGLLGATGAPGLFAISSLARNGGGDLANIMRGGIPTGGGATGQPSTMGTAGGI